MNLNRNDRDDAISLHSDMFKDAHNVRPHRSWEGVPTADIWAAVEALTPSDEDVAGWAVEQASLEARWAAEAVADEAAEAAAIVAAQVAAVNAAEDAIWAQQDALEA